MTTQEVAEKLVAHCREGKNLDAIEDLYADNIVSKEMPGMPHSNIEGKAGVIEKHHHWEASVEEIHGGTVSDPIVSGNFFAVTMDMDVTFKERGRTEIHEVAVYEVKDSQIVSEQFFYSM